MKATSVSSLLFGGMLATLAVCADTAKTTRSPKAENDPRSTRTHFERGRRAILMEAGRRNNSQGLAEEILVQQGFCE